MIDVLETIVLEITINEPALSISNAGALFSKLQAAVDRNTLDIEMNFTAVKSIDSSTIAMMVKFIQYLSGSKRKVMLTDVAPEISRTFKLTKLSHFYQIRERKN